VRWKPECILPPENCGLLCIHVEYFYYFYKRAVFQILNRNDQKKAHFCIKDIFIEHEKH